MFQRLAVPASPAAVPAGAPGLLQRTEPSFFSAPEAMKVDYMFVDSENGNSGDIVIRPFLHEREFWVEEPVLPSTYNNLARVSDSDDYGEWWLDEPFLAVRGHAIGIEIQNRFAGMATGLIVTMQGVGSESGREYSLRFDCNVPPGTVNGVQQAYGGRDSYVSGREDVWIRCITWARKPGNPDEEGVPFGFDPRLIGMQIKPSYGVKWSGPGGGGAGGSFIPLIVMSNIRGPRAACFYKPSKDLVLEQNDVFGMEVFPYTPNNPTDALIALVGTTISE